MAYNGNRKGMCQRCHYVHKRGDHNPIIIKQAEEKETK